MMQPLTHQPIGRPFTCEWWLEDRTQCHQPATVEIPRAGEGEASQKYCAKHGRIADTYNQDRGVARMHIVGSFDNMEFDRNMPLTFTTVPATDESDDDPTEVDDAADYSWTHDRS